MDPITQIPESLQQLKKQDPIVDETKTDSQNNLETQADKKPKDPSLFAFANLKKTFFAGAKTLLTSAVLQKSLADKKQALSLQDQKNNIKNKIQVAINADTTLSDVEKKQSIAAISSYIAHLPNDEQMIEKSLNDIFALSDKPKEIRQGHFVHALKTNTQELGTEKQKEILLASFRDANPKMSDLELKALVDTIQAFPSETEADKKIFVDTINSLNQIQQNKDLSAEAQQKQSASVLLKAMTQYQESRNSDADKEKLIASQKELVGSLVANTFNKDGFASNFDNKLNGFIQSKVDNLTSDDFASLINFAQAFLDSEYPAKDLMRDDLQLTLPKEDTAKAQTLIADTLVDALDFFAEDAGIDLNIAQLKADLSAGENTIVGENGELDASDAVRISKDIAKNILEDPQSTAEKNANQEANSKKEIQHQEEVRRQARCQINNLRGFKALFKSAAISAASSWRPGYRGSGRVGREVTNKMNKGYEASKAQANSQMRSAVEHEVEKQVSEALDSPETQEIVNLLAQTLQRSSVAQVTDSDSLRIDDMTNLQSLAQIKDHIAKERIDIVDLKKDVEGQDGANYTMFSDASTKKEFYERTDSQGKVRYAVKNDNSQTGWSYLDKDFKLAGEDFSAQINKFKEAQAQENNTDIAKQAVAEQDREKTIAKAVDNYALRQRAYQQPCSSRFSSSRSSSRRTFKPGNRMRWRR